MSHQISTKSSWQKIDMKLSITNSLITIIDGESQLQSICMSWSGKLSQLLNQPQITTTMTRVPSTMQSGLMIKNSLMLPLDLVSHYSVLIHQSKLLVLKDFYLTQVINFSHLLKHQRWSQIRILISKKEKLFTKILRSENGSNSGKLQSLQSLLVHQFSTPMKSTVPMVLHPFNGLQTP